jgi:glycosyltransferase involved in cell wall biosynthesis
MKEDKNPTFSVVIPAYNESQYLPDSIQSVRHAFSDTGEYFYEIIVSDDDSTDGTADIARMAGTHVVQSGRRNIGATRNVGANVARGEYILFLDADTCVDREVVNELKEAMQRGVVGAGACIRWSEPASLCANAAAGFWNTISRTLRWPCGSFFLVRRDAFEAVGGFDEEYFASEEIHLARKLKKYGRIEILHGRIASSPRKIDQLSWGEITRFLLRWCIAPRKTLQDRKNLGYWYSKRDTDAGEEEPNQH